MVLLLTLMLALDLSGIKSEPKLEKRSQLALQFADSELDSARDLTKRAIWPPAVPRSAKWRLGSSSPMIP